MLGNKHFEKINKALGFELYQWQIDYIRGDSDYIPSGRCNGKTLAFVLRQLLNYEKQRPVIARYDEFYENFVCDREDPPSYVKDWYIRFVYDVAYKLHQSGIETCFKFKE